MSLSFGKKIKEIRLAKSMTLDDLSKESGLSKGFLSKLENGHRGTPKTDTIARLSNGLDYNYIDLLQMAGYIEEAEKEALANAARMAAEVNKNTNDKIRNSNQIINPEKFPDPNTIRKKVNVPIEYTVNGELREFENNDLFDLYYLMYLGMDNNDIINLTFKGNAIEKEKLSKVLDAIRLILE